MKKIIKYFKQPSKILLWLCNKNIFWFLSDKTYLKMKYRLVVGKKLNLKNPKTFNEKLQWLKLYDRKPIYTTMVDKYEAKKYVASIIGEEYIIPTLGVYNHFDEIDFDKLPNQFVIKCTHDSGGIVIVKDKKELNIEEAKKKIEKCLKRNYFYSGREWSYKNIKPRIIIEKYMVDESQKELKDYKIFTFDGKAKIIEVDFDRFIEHKRNLYDTDWKYIEAIIKYPTDKNVKINKPKSLNKMLELAEKLSKDIPHVRTDFYSIDDKIYFGELTFYHESGYGKFVPEEFGEELGSWIKLPHGGGVLVNGNVYILVRFIESELTDYKVMCFNGKPQMTFTCTDRYSDGLKVTFFDLDWNKLPFERHYPKSNKVIKKPKNYSKMLELSKQLSENMMFLRVDWYEINGKLYFGELTFYPGSGFEEFTPDEWDYKLGNYIILNNKNI